MENQDRAVHRTIVAVDVEGFGNRNRTNRNQLAVRDGLYKAMSEAFLRAGIPWSDRDHEDRGDGMFILAGSEVPKSLFAEPLPAALVNALRRHNSRHSDTEQIRLRMALHAGEVNYDQHGATSVSINLTFRLLESAPLKMALAGSSGVLAVIASSWFFEEVIRHSPVNAAGYAPVPVVVKETTTTGWICLPDQPDPAARLSPGRLPAATATASLPAASQHAANVRAALARACTSALAEPITPAGDMPAWLTIPTLGEGYIDHRIRVAEVTSSSDPGRESWWAEAPIADSATDFLLARLSEPRALAAPLVLLGQPGSGKSVLTRILAARLSAAGFLPVRVELRQAAAEADLQGQLEFAIRNATGEIVRWPEIAESGGGVLPIAIFDGFDELLQATGIMQSDFLLRIQEFQERETRLGRPLAVIVTSRSAVTDRASFPHGTTAIRLEPFDAGQITAWLEIWAETNGASFSGRGMCPLPVSVALSYSELAEQPLLLLMLALYDADANVLQHRSTALSRTELYGRLLSDFASREIRKHSPASREDDLSREVEAELLRLSVVAFAMFNRRSQWVPEADLDADFSALLIDAGARKQGPGRPEGELTAAQLTVGRFFFVHEARAVQGNRRLRTYEFLHATFGEFLVARMVVNILTGMLSSDTASVPAPQHGTDGGLLYALLSLTALSARGPVVAFLGDLLDQLEKRQRADIAEILLGLHVLAMYPQDESAYSNYQPLVASVPTKHAAWSANLVLLAVLAAGEITGSQLFPLDPNTQLAWRAEVLIWRAQLGGYGWEGLHEAIALNRIWDDRRKEIRLTRNDGTFIPEALDMAWTFNIPPGPVRRKEIFSSLSHNSSIAPRKINFSTNMHEDILAHGLAPLVSSFPATAHVFVVLADGRVVSAVNALACALSAPYREGPPGESAYLDLAQVTGKLVAASDVTHDAPYLKMALGVLISAMNQGVVSPGSARRIAGLIGNVATEDPKLAELLARLDRLRADYGPTGEAGDQPGLTGR